MSNHEDLRPIADAFGIRFEVFKITKDTKRAQEDLEIALCRELDVDIVVLARYMQIMSDEFCDAFTHKCINIHHSFLPAFIGSKPYHRAHARGVPPRRPRSRRWRLGTNVSTSTPSRR